MFYIKLHGEMNVNTQNNQHEFSIYTHIDWPDYIYTSQLYGMIRNNHILQFIHWLHAFVHTVCTVKCALSLSLLSQCIEIIFGKGKERMGKECKKEMKNRMHRNIWSIRYKALKIR